VDGLRNTCFVCLISMHNHWNAASETICRSHLSPPSPGKLIQMIPSHDFPAGYCVCHRQRRHSEILACEGGHYIERKVKRAGFCQESLAQPQLHSVKYPSFSTGDFFSSNTCPLCPLHHTSCRVVGRARLGTSRDLCAAHEAACIRVCPLHLTSGSPRLMA
jgi:hypothetical protein